MAFPHLTDIGAHVALQAGGFLQVVAGGGADNVAQSGPRWIDRAIPLGRATATVPAGTTGLPAFSPRVEGPYDSAVLALVFDAHLAQAATMTASLTCLTAADSSGTGSAVYATVPAAVVATGPTGGGVVRGVLRLNLRLDLAAAGPYVKEQWTVDLSAANTDLVNVYTVWVFGGSDVVPVA